MVFPVSQQIAAEEKSQAFGSPEDVSFLSTLDGTPQRFVILLPENFDENIPHDVMIALHGHGSDRWQFITEKRPECQAARDIAATKHDFYFSRLPCENFLDGASSRGGCASNH